MPNLRLEETLITQGIDILCRLLKGKADVEDFFSSQRTVHNKFILEKCNVNNTTHTKILHCLRETTHHNLKVGCYTITMHQLIGLLLQEYLTKNGISMPPQLPYSPDIATANYYLQSAENMINAMKVAFMWVT
jgi:hypothetical protein